MKLLVMNYFIFLCRSMNKKLERGSLEDRNHVISGTEGSLSYQFSGDCSYGGKNTEDLFCVCFPLPTLIKGKPFLRTGSKQAWKILMDLQHLSLFF